MLLNTLIVDWSAQLTIDRRVLGWSSYPEFPCRKSVVQWNWRRRYMSTTKYQTQRQRGRGPHIIREEGIRRSGKTYRLHEQHILCPRRVPNATRLQVSFSDKGARHQLLSFGMASAFMSVDKVHQQWKNCCGSRARCRGSSALTSFCTKKWVDAIYTQSSSRTPE